MLIFALALGACDTEPATQTTGDFAVLARSVEGFSEAQPGYVLEFPRDHAPHPDYRIEWWYLTANLRDAGGNPYGIQWTLFRLARRPQRADSSSNPWHDKQVYMAHIALTWPKGHVGYQRYARGGVHDGIAQAGVTAVPFAAWLDDWTLSSIGESWLPLQVNARQGDFAFQLALESEQNLVLQGDKGFSQKHADGSGSYYYSQPFLMASGDLSIAGKSIPVSGEAWLDREWSSQFLHPEQAGWDWFALHLDSGEKLMLFRLRQRDAAEDSQDVTFGVLIAPGGEKKPLSGGQIRLEPSGSERIAGRDLPLSWHIVLSEINRDLEVRALIPDQWMYVDFAYWEGAVMVEGDSAGSRGVGYMELTGYPLK
jgi:predicted secreted hydrolase